MRGPSVIPTSLSAFLLRSIYFWVESVFVAKDLMKIEIRDVIHN
jgi:hypothetical protein